MKPLWTWHTARNETEIKEKNKWTTKTHVSDGFQMDCSGYSTVPRSSLDVEVPWNCNDITIQMTLAVLEFLIRN